MGLHSAIGLVDAEISSDVRAGWGGSNLSGTAQPHSSEASETQVYNDYVERPARPGALSPREQRGAATGSYTLSELVYYPVKSMAGTSVARAVLGRRGIMFDRHWMVISGRRGQVMTQRGKPALALLRPKVTMEKELTITAPEGSQVTIGPGAAQTRRVAQVWGSSVEVCDEGDAVAAWLSEYLRKECRLVRIADDVVRRVDERFGGTGEVGLADGFPLLVMGRASLADLNRRLQARQDAPVSMDRFRPNIVVDGAEALAEDTWATMRIGEVVCDLVKPCARCEIPNTDQRTAQRSPAVLSLLEEYRTRPGFKTPVLGWNAIHREVGTLAVGTAVEVVRYRDEAM